MRSVFVTDVGDGQCITLETGHGEYLQVDWGSNDGSLLAFRRWIHFPALIDGPRAFVLSHYHMDHYNGLMQASLYHSDFLNFTISDVYFPRIPDFQEKTEFLREMFVMNSLVLGADSGSKEYDYLKAIGRLNHGHRCRYQAKSKGDEITFGGSRFAVLWPPRILGNQQLSRVRAAMESFQRASGEYPQLRYIHERISREEFVEKLLFEDGGLIEELETKEGPAEDLQSAEFRKLPKAVKEANELFTRAANDLCLAFREDKELVFFGDAEDYELAEIVKNLRSDSATRFFYLITPHHGTHWDDSLNKIFGQLGITSNGRRMSRYWNENFKQISSRSFSTWSNGHLRL